MGIIHTLSRGGGRGGVTVDLRRAREQRYGFRHLPIAKERERLAHELRAEDLREQEVVEARERAPVPGEVQVHVVLERQVHLYCISLNHLTI